MAAKPPNNQTIALIRRAGKVEHYKRDFLAFCREQLLIRPKIGPITHLELWPHQKLIEQVVEKQYKERGWIRLVEFKCRQEGGSTHSVARVVHKTFLNENISSLIIAHDDAATENLFNMAQLYYDGLDADIRPVRRYLTKQEIVLENPDVKTRSDFPGLRSRINIQSAKNIHSGVGTTRNVVALSEFCRFGQVRDLMGSLLPAVPLQPGTAIINESAPFGYGEGRDHFRAWCDKARSGKDQYVYVAVYWWMCPGYDVPLDKSDTLNGRFRVSPEERRIIRRVQEVSKKELGTEITLTNEQIKFRRMRIEELGRGDALTGEQIFKQQYASDYESAWETYDAQVFDQWKMAEMRKRYERGPLRRCDVLGDEVFDVPGGNAPLWIWEEPQPGELYDIGVDTAAGVGGNASALEVFKRSNNEQVAEYINDKIGPLDYAKIVYSIGLWYNGAHVGAEVEGIGFAVDEALKQLGYPNIYQWRLRNHVVPKLSSFSGWKTQFDTKRLMVAVANDLIAHDNLIIHSSRLFAEMGRFIQLFTDSGNEQYVAQEGNDDAIMAAMITWVIARDERAIEMPMEKGVQFDRPTTLAERNKRLQEGLERTTAHMDNGDRLITGTSDDARLFREGKFTPPMSDRDEGDPWIRFANAMSGKDQQ